ncbi:hemolysin XhlA [Aneurinibacillus soli]|uniref:Hemolysin XhlA n=1 Tax=Aneurinibacillus soli TaxID=1500254 RepID=A0A0U5B6A5_9BACL|nr:hemolysin XhlA family protein [Aneurinibacillus soli]PYE62998.1 hemolysin XhlA [Aneurinibacillus soli]BAU28943.1 hemolysin XhlA [Aneurinibacillus soli]
MQEGTELLERMVRMETKLDFIIQDRERLEITEKIAQEALSLTNENTRDIAEMKSDRNRMWGAIAGGIITFIGSLFYFLLTK